MNALLLFFVTSLGYLIAYHTYGRFLAKKIFKINEASPVPSKELEDGVEYVPTKRHVIFGHHFTSIAGTGPIVGPAIGIIWGWVPAVLWVFFGSIFMGAVHDFATLIISTRHQGKSIADITGLYINDRVRLMFYIIVFLALLIVIAIFGLVIAIIFATFPQSVLPVWIQIPIALSLGSLVFKKDRNLILGTAIAVGVMYLTILLGANIPINMPDIAGIPATGIWTILLLVYAFIASVLPVTTLLQPRDYMNAWQLYIALGIIVLGMVVTGVTEPLIIEAPALNLNPPGAPSIWPFLFITIACGAISGFHCLVSSGTSSKQLSSESDAQFIGYGAMLTEALLATIVIIAVTAGLGLAYETQDGVILHGISAWNAHYGSWASSAGLGSKLTAVVVGCSNFMASLSIPTSIGVAIIGVFIASFAGTTLDSATRVQRYIISELFEGTGLHILSKPLVATSIAVVTAALLAFSSGANGKGALLLWPLFGAVNQLLGGLALLVSTAYLKTKGNYKFLVTAIPCLFLMVITLWASIINHLQFWEQGNVLLLTLNGVISLLAFLIVIETLLILVNPKTLKREAV
jgi:carbon starvation protein